MSEESVISSRAAEPNKKTLFGLQDESIAAISSLMMGLISALRTGFDNKFRSDMG
jgi:hypothetical protein